MKAMEAPKKVKSMFLREAWYSNPRNAHQKIIANIHPKKSAPSDKLSENILPRLNRSPNPKFHCERGTPIGERVVPCSKKISFRLKASAHSICLGKSAPILDSEYKRNENREKSIYGVALMRVSGKFILNPHILNNIFRS
jgi:hypothetical protein